MTKLADKAREALEGATPGRWLVPDQTWRRKFTVETNDLIACPGSGGSASYTYEICELGGSGTLEWESNAYLIALAPDLAHAVLAAEALADAAMRLSVATQTIGGAAARDQVLADAIEAHATAHYTYRKATEGEHAIRNLMEEG